MLPQQNICLMWLLPLLMLGSAVTIYEFGSVETAGESTHSLDHSSGLSEAMGRIFDSRDACDFLIMVQGVDKGNSVQIETVCAHKMVLSPFTPFNVSGGDGSVTVQVSLQCLQHFSTFIRYLYTRRVNVTTSSVQCFHWMASHFGAKELMEDTGRLFTNILPEDASFRSQVSLYNYAVEMGDVVLQENCLRYLAWNFRNLTTSPAWRQVSVKLLEYLLHRADLVVPDEYFVLQSVESWLAEKGNSTSLEMQAKLLSQVRFPMIPAERLNDLEASSPLYGAHRGFYQEKMLKALQFNVLLFSTIQKSPAFNAEDPDYQSRIYTAEPWSTVIDPSKRVAEAIFRNPVRIKGSYGSYSHRNPPIYSSSLKASFVTPVHNSLIFQKEKVKWDANVYEREHDCSVEGLHCSSLPMVRLLSQNSASNPKVVFRNQVLLVCRGQQVVSHVQDFKNSLSPITVNGADAVSYRCPGDKYTFQFVVRPQYI